MATTETGHQENRVYVDQDGQLHLNGASIYTDESGTAISGTELANAANVAAPIAGGSSLTLTAAHHNRTVLLDTAAGTTITLPAATGSGLRFRLAVTVAPTSNQHRVNVTGNDAFVGTINILDLDSTAQAAFAAGSDADQINLNGTTTGGKIGDWLTFEDVLADRWHVMGQLQCPAGSNVATPFATGQVS